MTAPFSGPSIRDALRAQHAEGMRYWGAFDTATFLSPIGEAWSPADNVRHLTKSIRAVARGFRLPSLLVRLRFGRSAHPSRTYEGVRDVYIERLGRGARAGPFSPGPLDLTGGADAARTRIMSYHAVAVDGLASATARWSERALDRCRLPHPALGMLTAREMLFFTLYHNQHHRDNVRRRLAGVAAGAGDAD